MSSDSEYRLYVFISGLLKEIGWNNKSPEKGGDLYTQHEIFTNPGLKAALKNKVPDHLVRISEDNYWVIEAKRDEADLPKAIKEAMEYADMINIHDDLQCEIITGIAGSIDDAYYIETRRLVNNKWEIIRINNRKVTGLLTKQTIRKLLQEKESNLFSYDIEDNLFRKKMEEINDIMHQNGINKRNRAGVLACLLLAVANDPSFRIEQRAAILITDINTRARNELSKYKRESFYPEIEIKPPASEDNHVKYRQALSKSITILKGLNISSTIGGGRDIIGECYELFLKHANDAKEIGIVLTPRHITQFAVKAVGVQKNDIVFDPCCGTGGFLVGALDHVRSITDDIADFKKGNLYGIESDPLIATLAIINMVFRGDGNSKITEGNCFTSECDYTGGNPTRVLMNPPFALPEYEHRFIDRALRDLETSGLLFAVVPTTSMTSADNRRHEITWRQELVKRHSLLAVIKLPEMLFYPNAAKGTYGIFLKAHIPHKNKQKVLWAIMSDGKIKSKLKKKSGGNIDYLCKALRAFIATEDCKEYKAKQIDCTPIQDMLDLSPEHHIGIRSKEPLKIDVDSVIESQIRANIHISFNRKRNISVEKCRLFLFKDIFYKIEKGASGRSKELSTGYLPLISTSEEYNGISGFVNESQCNKVYKNMITISANGGSCYAAYHKYKFAANPDVFVGQLNREYERDDIYSFICGAINEEKWRFNYCRKFSSDKLQKFKLKLPINEEGNINKKYICAVMKERIANYPNT